MESFVSGLSEAVKNIYRGFFLRDVLGKLLPGMILTVTFLLISILLGTELLGKIDHEIGNPILPQIKSKFELLFTAKDSPSFSFVIWFIFIGISYIAGHAGQTALEVLGLLSAHPYPKWRLGKVTTRGKTAREKFANRLTALKGDKVPKGQLDQRERYVIIKDMTGNLILPCFVIGITVLLFKSWVWCLFFLLTSGVMWVSHAAHRRRQYELEVRILKEQNILKLADYQMD